MGRDMAAIASPADRRRRRVEVERLLIDGKSASAIAEFCATEFGVSMRTGFADCELVLRRWAREDGKSLSRRRATVVRGLERIAAKAEAVGEFSAAVSARTALARIVGLIDTKVAIDARTQMVVFQFPDRRDDARLADPDVVAARDAYLASFDRPALRESGDAGGVRVERAVDAQASPSAA